MIQFSEIDETTFLTDYWQKQACVIRQAIPAFDNPLSAEELAGLSLEQDIESRIVIETPEQAPHWQLKRGPFTGDDYEQLPESHWTLLVQGVDRLMPDVTALLDHFNFLPQWRVDDVMVSYAAIHGSVGPHYDNYDVFLYQAQGQRRWLLTSKNCTPDNALTDVELRIMKQFDVEQEIILEAGDMLYLPPHIGHHGIALTDDCMTYSFGYRSYREQEMLESVCDHIAEQTGEPNLYCDPNWNELNASNELPDTAWQQAKNQLQTLLDDEQTMKQWFARFATQLDHEAEEQLPIPFTDEEAGSVTEFIETLGNHSGLVRDPLCRFTYYNENERTQLFINGHPWQCGNVCQELIATVANNRTIPLALLTPHICNTDNQVFLHQLWQLQWLQWV